MKDPVRGEIFPLVGKKSIEQVIRNDPGYSRESSRNRHDQGEYQIQPRRNAQDLEILERAYAMLLPGADRGKPGAEHKQQLPAKRIQVPAPVGK